MYLFSRSVRLAPGNVEKSMTWAVKITEKVNQIAEPQIEVWTKVFSPGSGTLVWVCTVDDLISLETAEAKMLADSGYLALVEEGAALGSGDAIDDALVQLVFPNPDAAELQATYATTVVATLAPGATTRGVELGVEIAQRATAVSGCPTSFGVGATGPYGAVEWFTLYTSVEQMQRGLEAINADADFTAVLDKEASKVYLPNAEQTIYRKIA